MSPLREEMEALLEKVSRSTGIERRLLQLFRHPTPVKHVRNRFPEYKWTRGLDNMMIDLLQRKYLRKQGDDKLVITKKGETYLKKGASL